MKVMEALFHEVAFIPYKLNVDNFTSPKKAKFRVVHLDFHLYQTGFLKENGTLKGQ